MEVISPDQIRPTDKVIQLKPFQDQFIFSLKRFCAFVGGWATGKDMSTIARGMDQSEKFRRNNGLIVRAEFTDLRDSTMLDFRDYTGLKIGSDRNSTLGNGSVIMFRHAEEIADEKNLNNMNLGWFAMIQADEFESEVPFLKLSGRLRRCHGICDRVKLVRPDLKCDCYQTGFVSANANAEDWIAKLFGSSELSIKGSLGESSELVEAKSTENQDVLPVAYVQSWEVVRQTKPEIYDRYVLNSRKVGDEKFIVLPMSMVRQAVGATLIKSVATKRVTVVDPAEGDFDQDGDDDGEGGGDECVIYDLEDSGMVDEEIYKHVTLMDTCGRVIAHAEKNGSNVICVDIVGIGLGLFRRLEEIFEGKKYMKVYAFDGRRVPPQGFENQFVNYKTYAWFNARDKYFIARNVRIKDDPELIRQLSKMRYKYTGGGRGGKYVLWPKRKMNKITGCSSDRAEALVMGLEALDHAPASGMGAHDEETQMSVHPFYRRAMHQMDTRRF